MMTGMQYLESLRDGRVSYVDGARLVVYVKKEAHRVCRWSSYGRKAARA